MDGLIAVTVVLLNDNVSVKAASNQGNDLILIVVFSECCRCKGKGKGKGHPCTGTEALYRPYGP